MPTVLQRVAVGGAVAALTVTTAVLTALPAAADVETFNDGGSYLTTVTVRHGVKNLRVKAKVGDYEIPSNFTFWLEVDPDDPGPEYKIQVYPNSEVVPIRAVENFADRGEEVECDYSASADAGGSKYVGIVIPRDCLDTPAAVRVSVRANYAIPGPNVEDWGPGKRRFFGWVSGS